MIFKEIVCRKSNEVTSRREFKLEKIADIEKFVGEFKLGKIARIEKLISEYNIWAPRVPHGKFKIRIYRDLPIRGGYSGITNLRFADGLGDFCGGVGMGKTEEIALENTLNYFFEMLSKKDIWEEGDFEYSDPYDF